MRKIALFLILLPIWCCAEREPSRSGVVCSQLSAVEQAAELMAAVQAYEYAGFEYQPVTQLKVIERQ